MTECDEGWRRTARPRRGTFRGFVTARLHRAERAVTLAAAAHYAPTTLRLPTSACTHSPAHARRLLDRRRLISGRIPGESEGGSVAPRAGAWPGEFLRRFVHRTWPHSVEATGQGPGRIKQ